MNKLPGNKRRELQQADRNYQGDGSREHPLPRFEQSYFQFAHFLSLPG